MVMKMLDSNGLFCVLSQQIYTGLMPLRPDGITGHRETPAQMFSRGSKNTSKAFPAFYSALGTLLNLQHSYIYIYTLFQQFFVKHGNKT